MRVLRCRPYSKGEAWVDRAQLISELVDVALIFEKALRGSVVDAHVHDCPDDAGRGGWVIRCSSSRSARTWSPVEAWAASRAVRRSAAAAAARVSGARGVAASGPAMGCVCVCSARCRRTPGFSANDRRPLERSRGGEVTQGGLSVASVAPPRGRRRYFTGPARGGAARARYRAPGG